MTASLAEVLTYLRPGAQFVIRGEAIEWLGPGTQPTAQEIETARPAATAALALPITNEATLRQQLEAAIAANTADANAADAWVAANTGTLSTAVLSAQVRKLTTAAATAARQRNKLARLLLKKLDATT